MSSESIKAVKAVKRRLPRFRIRTLLLFITVLAMLFAWRAYRQRQASDLIQSLRADGYQVTIQTSAPFWIERLFLPNIVRVDGYGLKGIGVDRLEQLASLGTLRGLGISVRETGEDVFRAIGRMRRLTTLHLSAPKFPGEYLEHWSQMQELQDLYITNAIGDEGVAHLTSLQKLRCITISSDELTQAGVQQFSVLPKLRVLILRGGLRVSGETRQVLQKVGVDDGSFKARLRMIP